MICGDIGISVYMHVHIGSMVTCIMINRVGAVCLRRMRSANTIANNKLTAISVWSESGPSERIYAQRMSKHICANVTTCMLFFVERLHLHV